MTADETITNEAVNTWLHAVAKTEAAKKALVAAGDAFRDAAGMHAAATWAEADAEKALIAADINIRAAEADEIRALVDVRAACVAENEGKREGNYEN